MTASQAIRKGAEAFATELQSLTGGDKGVGPPPDKLRRGMKVEVKHKKGGGNTCTSAKGGLCVFLFQSKRHGLCFKLLSRY